MAKESATATAKAEEAKSAGRKTTNNAVENAPGDGAWEDAGTPEIDGWYSSEMAKANKQWVVGKCMAWIKLAGKRDATVRRIVLIQLEEPIACTDASEGHRESEDKTVTLQPGQILAVDVKAKLPLLQYVANKCRVRFLPDVKIPIGGGQTMWKFKFQAAKNSKTAKPPPAANESTSAEEVDESDIPF